MRNPILTPQQRREIAAAAIVPEKTVRNVYAHPERVRASTLERVAKGARERGLPEPVPPNGSEAA